MKAQNVNHNYSDDMNDEALLSSDDEHALQSLREEEEQRRESQMNESQITGENGELELHESMQRLHENHQSDLLNLVNKNAQSSTSTKQQLPLDKKLLSYIVQQFMIENQDDEAVY